jgi:hypothetical protein
MSNQQCFFPEKLGTALLSSFANTLANLLAFLISLCDLSFGEVHLSLRRNYLR